MLDKVYEELVRYLEGMIADVQLVVGGHLLGWEDTKVPALLSKISREKENIEGLSFEIGDLLKNRCTGQKAVVMLDEGEVVHLLPVKKVVIYPLAKLWHHYEKSKPGG